jgi:hypothetical protein
MAWAPPASSVLANRRSSGIASSADLPLHVGIRHGRIDGVAVEP